MTAWAKRNALAAYFIISFAVFWSCIGLGLLERFRFWLPVLGAFAPALAACMVSGWTEGEAGVRTLIGRLGKWRCGPLWYLAAFGLPLAEGLTAVAVATLFQASSGSLRSTVADLGTLLPAFWIVFLFAAGEEIGWRGFALTRLLETHDGLTASVMLGSAHALWHWPLILLPNQWLSAVPLAPYTVAVVAEAIVFTWIARNTNGSLLLAAVFHGMSNVAMVFYEVIDDVWMPWLKCGISVGVGGGVILVAGRRLAPRVRR